MMPATTRTYDERFVVLMIDALIESGHNPRRHFDEVKLIELAESIREKGIVEPLVVRPLTTRPVEEDGDDLYEIVAGARRYRAAKLADLTHVPCIVRNYSDEDVLELFLVENVQRDDLAPLEQARGFKQLLDANPDKYSAATIATKVGMSPAWVWDRLKLLDLIPDAQALLEQGRISVGHAIVLARLKPEDQARAIARPGGTIGSQPGGLWTAGSADGLPYEEASLDQQKDPYGGLKPVTVRELQRWIDDHVRFDVQHAAQAQPLQFADVAERVEAATAQPGKGQKVIAITFDGYVQPSAKSADERTYGPRFWKFADGQEHEIDTWSRKTKLFKACEHRVLGIVVAGPRRGQAFEVCIARDKCLVHWKAEIAEKRKQAELRSAGNEKAADDRAARDEDKWRRQQEERRQRVEAWHRIQQPVTAAAVTQVVKQTALTPGQAAHFEKSGAEIFFRRDVLREHLGPAWHEQLAAAVLVLELTQAWADDFDEFIAKVAKPLGLDLKPILAARDAHSAAPDAPAAPAKKAAKRR